MTLFLPLAAMAGSLLRASPAAADPPIGDSAYDQCINNTSTNLEWGACGSAYLDRLDTSLNDAWKRAMASLDDKQSRDQLLAEQRAWLKFRDASCQVYANGSFGREGQVLHFILCRAGIISARISDLKGIYELTHQDER
jgi:uncharacterized protein YecT (DUF1311 family)